eukprot:3434378-Lingulodinium_polyedra.AAC.1
MKREQEKGECNSHEQQEEEKGNPILGKRDACQNLSRVRTGRRPPRVHGCCWPSYGPAGEGVP